mmetsp:Transcript_862/g.2680  ORF Transcript_862/g.2680 Transcript_862/m.2680 type:complete len:282 (+) Transcript_862:1375-2220(+)
MPGTKSAARHTSDSRSRMSSDGPLSPWAARVAKSSRTASSNRWAGRAARSAAAVPASSSHVGSSRAPSEAVASGGSSLISRSSSWALARPPSRSPPHRASASECSRAGLTCELRSAKTRSEVSERSGSSACSAQQRERARQSAASVGATPPSLSTRGPTASRPRGNPREDSSAPFAHRLASAPSAPGARLATSASSSSAACSEPRPWSGAVPGSPPWHTTHVCSNAGRCGRSSAGSSCGSLGSISKAESSVAVSGCASAIRGARHASQAPAGPSTWGEVGP